MVTIFITILILIFVFRAKIFAEKIAITNSYQVISQGVCQSGISYTVRKCESIDGKPCINSEGKLSYDYEITPAKCIPPISQTVFSTVTPLDISLSECISSNPRCIRKGEKGTRIKRYYSTEGIKKTTSTGVKISGGLQNISSLNEGESHTLHDGTIILKSGGSFYIDGDKVTKAEALQRSLYYEEKIDCTPSIPVCGTPIPCITRTTIRNDCPVNNTTPFASGYHEYKKSCDGICEFDEICQNKCLLYLRNYSFPNPDFQQFFNSFFVIGTSSRVQTSTTGGDIFSTGVISSDIPKVAVYNIAQLVSSTSNSVTINLYAFGRYSEGWVSGTTIGDSPTSLTITKVGSDYFFNGNSTPLIFYPFDNDDFYSNSVYQEFAQRI